MPWTPPAVPMVMPRYVNITVPAGNTLTNPTTETQFASKYSPGFAANELQVGEEIVGEFFGTYMIPGSVGPTCTAKVYFGSTLALTSGTLSVGVGTGTIYQFWGEFSGVVRSLGATGTIYVTGNMTFETGSPPTPTGAPLGVLQGLITVDTTSTLSVSLAVVASNVANQYFVLNLLRISKRQACPAST